MPVPDEHGRHRRSLLREQAYVSIRDAIVNGTLVPGETLRDPELEGGWASAAPRSGKPSPDWRPPGWSIPCRVARRWSRPSTAKRCWTPRPSPRPCTRLRSECRSADGKARLPPWSGEQGVRRRGLRTDPEAAIRADDVFHGIAVETSQNQTIPVALEQVTPVLRRGVPALRFAVRPPVDSAAQADHRAMPPRRCGTQPLLHNGTGRRCPVS